LLTIFFRNMGGVLELPNVFLRNELITLGPEALFHSETIKMILLGQAGETSPGDYNTPEMTALVRNLPEAIRLGMTKVERIWKHVFPDRKMRLNTVCDAEREAMGDAEQKAAKNLNVDPLAVALGARKLWGRGLTEERDRRISDQKTGQMAARSLQAIRGHVSRQLLKELRPLLETIR